VPESGEEGKVHSFNTRIADHKSKLSNMADEKIEKSAAEQHEAVAETEEARVAHDALNGKYSPWTGAMISLYIVLIVPYLCGTLNGFDGSLMGAINAMTSYQDFFDMYVHLH
jgi:hypothetical protein